MSKHTNRSSVSQERYSERDLTSSKTRPHRLSCVAPELVKCFWWRRSISCGKPISRRLQSLLVQPESQLNGNKNGQGHVYESDQAKILPALSSVGTHAVATASVHTGSTEIEFRESEDGRRLILRRYVDMKAQAKSSLCSSTFVSRAIRSTFRRREDLTRAWMRLISK